MLKYEQITVFGIDFYVCMCPRCNSLMDRRVDKIEPNREGIVHIICMHCGEMYILYKVD